MQDNKVAWLEGMFLQTQHFQQQDRYMENLLHVKIATIAENFWGFSEIQIDTQLLSVGKIGVASATGVFQDGTVFNFPEKDLLPTPFEIPESMNNVILYLAIPQKSHTAEIGTVESKGLYRYQVENIEIADSTADNKQSAEIQIGKLKCQILSEQDDRSGFHCLQFTKIAETRANQQITLEKTFLPHCLNVKVHAQLYQIIPEMHGLLSHRATMLAGRLTDTKQAGTAEIVDFMLLQLINRYEPIFYFLQHKKNLSPEKLFYILIQLIGEIATFTNDKRRPKELFIYQHDKPYETFQPLVRELRRALSVVLEQNATAIPLHDRSHGLWIGQFSEKELITTSNFILAVYADLPAENIRTAFPAQVKIAPVEQIRTLVSRQLSGVDLQPIAVAPRQIPYHANFSYFSINSQHEFWKMLEKSAGVAFHIGNHYPGLKLELWAIKA